MLNNGDTRISFWPRFTFSHIHNVILASQKVIRVAEMEVLLRDHCTTKMSETSFTHVKLSSETEATLFRLNLFYLLPSLHPLQVHQSSLKRFRWAFNNLDNCNAAASRSIIGVMSSSSSSLSEVGPSTKPFEGLKPWRSLS